jgi:N6-adenosine-specific RNA methylase IME4
VPVAWQGKYSPVNSLLARLPKNHFGAILADPPWRFQTWDKQETVKQRTSGRVHYHTMTIDEITALPIANYAAPDCALFLWVSWPQLELALEIIKEWGFHYKTCGFDWTKIQPHNHTLKVHMGMGYWTRSNTEPCLLATRGKPRRLHRDVRMAIIEPRREHSRKPDCVHERIERLVPGPYLELFGRQKRPGWTVRGDQVSKF